MKINQFAAFILLVCVLHINGFAQVGINTITPDSSASLHIVSKPSGSGLIIPELTEAQRLAIAKPAKGLIVFDLDANLFYMNMDTAPGNQWYAINPWLTKGSSTAINEMYTSSVVTKVGIGTNSPQATLDVNGGIKSTALNVTGFSSNALVPTGAIIMWSGDPLTLPTGWALCDGKTYGTLVTPDLRGRFIVGMGQNAQPNGSEQDNTNYNVGDKGGVNKYNLTAAESGLPSHTHTTNPHKHKMSELRWSKSNGYTDASGDGVGSTNSFFPFTDDETVIVNNSTPQNAAQAHENRPSYYALAYIIKLP